MTTEFLGYSNKFKRIYTCGIQKHNEIIKHHKNTTNLLCE